MKPNHLLKVSNFKLGKVFSLLLFCFAAAILSGSLTYQVQAVGISPPRVNIQTKVGVQTPITVRLIRSQGQDGNINMVVDLDGDMKEAFIGEPRFTIPSDVDIYEYTFHLKPIHYKESRQKLNVIFITDSIDVSGQLSDDDGGHAVSISTGVVVTTLFYVNPGNQVVPTPPVIEPEPVADDEIEKEEDVIEEEEEEEKEKEEIKEEDVIEEEEEKEAEEEIQEIKEDKIEEVQKIKEIKELTELEKRQERLMALREARQNEESPIFVTLEQVDFSGDGKIDASDVSTMAAAFTADYNPGFDLDGDGKVGTRDLSVLLSNWTAEVPKKKKKPPVPPGPPLKEDKVVLHTIADDKGSGLFVAASLSFMDRRNTFKTYVMLDTGVSAANASEMDFFYDSEVMTLIGMDIDSSVFTVWAEKPNEVAPGHIHFIGGVPDGFSGTDGVIVELEFEKHKDKLYAPTALTFSDDVKIYKENGSSFVDLETQGAKSIFEDETIMSRFEELGMKKPSKEKALEVPEKLEPLVLRSPTHPYENQWYKNKEVTINWSKSKVEYDSEEYLYVFTKKDKVELEDLIERTEDTKARFLVHEEGVWYFHAARVVMGKISGVYSFPVYLDLTGPELLYSRVEKRDVGDIQKKQFLVFNTIDKLSGTDYFLIKRGGKTIKLETGIYELPKLSSGIHIFKLQSVDAVGNISNHSVSIEVHSKPLPWNIIFTIIALCLVLMLRLIKFAVDKSKIKKLSEAV